MNKEQQLEDRIVKLKLAIDKASGAMIDASKRLHKDRHRLVSLASEAQNVSNSLAIEAEALRASVWE